MYRALYPDAHDRTKLLRVLELVAVLSRRLEQALDGFDQQDRVTSYDQMVGETKPVGGSAPEPQGFTFDEIDRLMARGE